MKVVPNQPYYFARLHWWERATRGTLVILDDVQRSSSNPPNRVVVFDGSEERFLPISSSSKYKMAPINEALVTPGWVDDNKNRIDSYFRKAPYREQALGLFSKFLEKAEGMTSVIDVVMASITVTAEELGVPLRIEFSSNLDLQGTKRSAKLVKICNLLGSSTVVLGKGALYLDEDLPLFKEAEIEVELQDWACPIPNRSILDAVAWYGKDRVREVLGITN